MPRLLSRNNRLLSRGGRLIRDDAACRSLCCAAGQCCEAIEPGIDFLPIPQGDPRYHACGNPNPGRFRACISNYFDTLSETVTTRRAVTRIDNDGDCPERCSTDDTVTVTTTRTMRQVGPAFAQTNGNGFCEVIVYVPIIFTRETRVAGAREGPGGSVLPYLCTDRILPERGQREEYGMCLPMRVGCWPLDGNTSPCAVSLDGQFGFPPTDRPGVTVNIAKTNTGCVHQFTEEIDESSPPVTRGPFFNPCGATYTTTTSFTRESTRQGTMTVEIGWELNCDGTPGPTTCQPRDTECTPPDIPYIVGTPCSGATSITPPAVIPRANVFACGSIVVDGWCYMFDPAGPFTMTPPAGAVVATEVITASTAKSCCECLPLCNKTDLRIDIPEAWVNASTSGDSPAPGGAPGSIAITPAFVQGKCCCLDGDRIRLARIRLTYERFWDADAGRFIQREEVETATALPPSDPNIPSMLVGLRRDYVGRARFPLRTRVFNNDALDATFDSGWQEVDAPGPLCEWKGEYGNLGNPLIDFLSPYLTLRIGNSLPLVHPRHPSVQPDGTFGFSGNRRVRIRRYSVAATCQTFDFTAQYEIFDENPDGSETPVQTDTMEMRFTIIPETPTPGQLCAGVCGPVVPVPGTVPGGGLTLLPPGEDATLFPLGSILNIIGGP